MPFINKIIKKGYLTYYDECFVEFFSSWKICYVILYDDSTFEWHLNGRNSYISGQIKLRKVFKYIAVGQICNYVHNRPELPDDIPLELMLGIPHSNSKNPSEMEYFHFLDTEEMTLWIRAIESLVNPNTEGSINVNSVAVDTGKIPENLNKNTNNQYSGGVTYYTNPPGYYNDVGVATGIGLGLGLGVAMTLPVMAMGSGWYCQPSTVIAPDMSVMAMDGCATTVMTTDVSQPLVMDYGYNTDIVTTTEFSNDFGTGFGF